MIQMVAVDSFKPENLYEYMGAHGLISGSLKASPGLILNLQAVSSYCIWNDGEVPLALMLELILPEPKCMEVIIIPEDKGLGKRKEEVVAFGHGLRDRWFGAWGMRRVQAHVPASRVNMHRIMRSLGFSLRTPQGLRNAIVLGDEPENLLVYDLIPSDPLKEWHPEAREQVVN